MCPLTPVAMRTGLGASSALAEDVIAARARTSGAKRRTNDMVRSRRDSPDCTLVKLRRNEVRALGGWEPYLISFVRLAPSRQTFVIRMKRRFRILLHCNGEVTKLLRVGGETRNLASTTH